MKDWVRKRFGEDADRLLGEDGKARPAADRAKEDECVYVPGVLPGGKKMNVCHRCGLPYAGARRKCDRKVELKRIKDAEAAAAAAEAELKELESADN